MAWQALKALAEMTMDLIEGQAEQVKVERLPDVVGPASPYVLGLLRVSKHSNRKVGGCFDEHSSGHRWLGVRGEPRNSSAAERGARGPHHRALVEARGERSRDVERRRRRSRRATLVLRGRPRA